ncbi:MAG: hypothetical protein WCD79_13780 [Chthoniobacteraceae bacterium]
MNPIRPLDQSNWVSRQSECERFFEIGQKVKPSNLDRFGYRLTARYVIAGGDYKIFELLPLDSSRAAEVSFLTNDIRLYGVIIADPFQEHKARLKTWTPLRLA